MSIQQIKPVNIYLKKCGKKITNQKQKAVCEICRKKFKKLPTEVTYDVYEEEGKISFVISDEKWLKFLFSNKKDGLGYYFAYLCTPFLCKNKIVFFSFMYLESIKKNISQFTQVNLDSINYILLLIIFSILYQFFDP